MKELLAFLSQKTELLIGQRFSPMKSPRKDGHVTQEALSFFADACNALSPDTEIKNFVADLDRFSMSRRVVAYEGAFSAAACLDVSHPREIPRIIELAELAPDHIAGLGLGVGHALSTFRVEADISQSLSEHYLGYMAMEAYGMHEGYFHWFDAVQKMRMPQNLPPLAVAAFDHGLGRAIFFIANGDARAILQLLERFPSERRYHLWRGIGLMASFWGVDDEMQLKRLMTTSKQYRPFFQQGAAQGIGMRVDMDDTTDHTSEAARLLFSAPVSDIAEIYATSLAKHSGETFDSQSLSNWHNELVSIFSDWP